MNSASQRMTTTIVTLLLLFTVFCSPVLTNADACEPGYFLFDRKRSRDIYRLPSPFARICVTDVRKPLFLRTELCTETDTEGRLGLRFRTRPRLKNLDKPRIVNRYRPQMVLKIRRVSRLQRRRTILKIVVFNNRTQKQRTVKLVFRVFFCTNPNRFIPPTVSATPSSTLTATPTPSSTKTRTATPTPTRTSSRTPTSTPTLTLTLTPTLTPTPTTTITARVTPTTTESSSPSLSATSTSTTSPTTTATTTPTITGKPSPTHSVTVTSSESSSTTATPTVSTTSTETATPTVSFSKSVSPPSPADPSSTSTVSFTPTLSLTPLSTSLTVTPTIFASTSVSASIDVSKTESISPVSTMSLTILPSPTFSVTSSALPSISVAPSVFSTVSVTSSESPSISVSSSVFSTVSVISSVSPSISVSPSVFSTVLTTVSASGSTSVYATVSMTTSATTSVFPSQSTSNTPTVSPSVPPSTSPAGVTLQSHSYSTFNAAAGPLVFVASGTTLYDDISDVSLRLNDVLVSSSDLTLTPTMLKANLDLLLGDNDVFLSIYSSEKTQLFEVNETVWVGSNVLTVNLLGAGGSTFSKSTTVIATLADNLGVQAIASTLNGTVMFYNLPERTIILEARSVDNDIGTNAVLGSVGTTSIDLSGFSEPSTVDNNNFSMGLSGWEIPPSTASSSVSVVTHEEDVGPSNTSVSRMSQVSPQLPMTAVTSLSRQARTHGFLETQSKVSSSLLSVSKQDLENKDLKLETDGEGEQVVKRTFVSKFGITGIRVRYRFITSEVPGGYFGSQYNDYFSISIRSKEAGGTISESASMNGLGLASFNPETGSTAWRQKILPLKMDGDVVEVMITVANVRDGALDSTVVLDFVEELDCLYGEFGEAIKAIGLANALVSGALGQSALSVSNGTGLPGPHNGQQDAFRHCYWNCRMAQSIGPDDAKVVGDLHEVCGNNDGKESIMDLKNNEIGRGYGSAGSSVDCETECLNGVKNGDLQLMP